MATASRPIPRPGVLDIDKYVGGGASGSDGSAVRVINIASNESALGPSPRAVAAFKNAGATLQTYPDGESWQLREKLARHHGLDMERIICGSGSDELLTLLGRAYAGPGDEIVFSAHGFLMYAIIARSVGATPVAAPERDLTADVDALLGCVTERTRIVYLANPNNPTGSYLTAGEVSRLHAGLPPQTLLVLDAAYAEFMHKNDYDAGALLVSAHENVVMVRTFSKVYGLAALRVGWMYCPAAVADAINRIRSPFNLNAPAQAAACAALDDVAHTDRVITNNDVVRPWFVAQLEGLGLTVNPSVGNFVLVRFPETSGEDAAAAFEALRAKGVLTRKMGGYGLPAWLRMSIGSQSEMSDVAAVVADFRAGS
ncbi:MAG: histidinol-phosphate transaminase [Alphaproteobacteria bacterium]